MGRQKNMIINDIFLYLKFNQKRVHRRQREEADSQTRVVSQTPVQQEVEGSLEQNYLDLFTPGSAVSVGVGCLAGTCLPSFPFSPRAPSLIR